MKFLLFLHSLLFVLVIEFTCTVSVSGPGTGSETTNGIAATVHYQEGTPAANLPVKIRPYNYLRDLTPLTSDLIDTVTDTLGRVLVKGLQNGNYTIEIIDPQRGEGVVFNSRVIEDHIENPGILFLNKLSAVSGIVNRDTRNITGSVQVFGLDRITSIDSTDGSYLIDSLAPGNYTIKILPSDPSYMQEVISSVSAQPDMETVVEPVKLAPRNAWLHSRRIYLNTSPTGADVKFDVFNFPLLIRLNENNFDFITAKSNGEDIRFVKEDNSPLMFQIERWDIIDNRAEIWVKIDTVHGNDSTQYIIMLWGNLDAKGTANSEAVFDTTIGYTGVWHMEHNTGKFVMDATGNHFDASCVSIPSNSQIPGVIGHAQYFNGTSSYMVLPNTASGPLNFTEDSKYSIAAWVKPSLLDSSFHTIVSKGNYQYGMQINRSNKYEIYEFRDKTGWRYTEANAVLDEWKYVVGVHDGNKQYLYIDGVLVSSTINVNSSGSSVVNTNNVCFGMRAGESHRNFAGSIDEIRILSNAADSNLIKLNFMNQRPDDKLVIFK
ncbi:MAG: DUF2341 domain-containing protein [Fibrobacter sp.]|nr:DUF2341 domain-containing protein [Fibrobacter sp.]